MELLSIKQIIEYAEKVRMSVLPGGNLYANYYQQHLSPTKFPAYFGRYKKSIVFLEVDQDLTRLHFVSSDLTDLREVLVGVSKHSLVLDYVGKEISSELMRVLSEAKFSIRAKFGRIVNYKFRDISSNYKPVIASQHHIRPLLTRMYDDFDPVIDHLCDFSSLSLLVKQGQVLLNINRNKITGYLAYELQGKKSFIRAWYSADNDIFMGGMQLLGAYHSHMSELAINSTYGWVDVSNHSAVTVYQRYGYEFDGLCDIIMVVN